MPRRRVGPPLEPGRPRKPDSVIVAIRSFEKSRDKSLFFDSLNDEEKSQVKAIVERLVAETDGAWTTTEYQQYATIAWFVERWDKETKDKSPTMLDPRAIDAIMRYKKALIDAMQAVRSGRRTSGFFDRLKEFALEAAKGSETLRIEYRTKDDAPQPTESDPPVLDIEPIPVEDASHDPRETQKKDASQKEEP